MLIGGCAFAGLYTMVVACYKTGDNDADSDISDI